MKSATEIAKYIVAFYQDRGDPITNLKLQKLLYYVQGWSLALHDRPMFDGVLQAWVHGPVNPDVYQVYKRYRWNPIAVAPDHVELPAKQRSLIDEVLDVYGTESAWSLERRTHNEAPWIEARHGLPRDVDSRNEISHASMKLFFGELAKS